MLSYPAALSVIIRLNSLTTSLADELKTIHDKMEGRGINPAESPIVQARLKEIENKLRIIGADQDNPVPFEN